MPVSLTNDIKQTAKASAAGRLLGTGPSDSAPFPWRELVTADVIGSSSLEIPVTERAFPSGAGTLTPSTGFAGLTDIFVLTGTAVAPFNLTLANGTVVNQQVRFIVVGDPNDNSINLRTAAAVSFSSVNPSEVIDAWWTGSTWTRRGLHSFTRSMIFGDGSPAGTLIPTQLGQIYRDNQTFDLWVGTGFTTSAWTQIGGQSAVEGVAEVSENLTGNQTLTLAQQYARVVGGELQFRVLNAAHSTPSSTLTIIIPDSDSISSENAVWYIEKPASQTGVVTIQRQTSGTINGVTSVALAAGRSVAYIRVKSNPGSAPVILVKGDTTEDQVVAGLLKVGTVRGIAREIVDGATIGADDNGKTLFVIATGGATVSAVSTLCPAVGDTFVCRVVSGVAGNYDLDGPVAGGSIVTLAQNEAATIVCQNGGSIRVYKMTPGVVIS